MQPNDEATKIFDPRDHLDNVKGNNYLPAAARMQWFRSEHPEGKVVSELMKLEGEGAMERAIFRTVVTIVRDGQETGSATGWGSETRNDFEDFFEKAETKSVSRALAALGYGTPVDPVVEDSGRPQRQGGYQQARGRLNNNQNQNNQARAGNGRPSGTLNSKEGTINPGQEKAIKSLQHRLGWSDNKLLDFVNQPIESLSESIAGALIKDLEKMLTEGGG